MPEGHSPPESDAPAPSVRGAALWAMAAQYVTFGVTFVTGTLFSLSHTLAQAATRIGPALGWVPDACTWLALVAGAVAGGLAYRAYGLEALAVPMLGVGLVLALAVGRAVRVAA